MLYFRNNSLTDLPSDMSSNKELREVILSNNRLVFILLFFTVLIEFASKLQSTIFITTFITAAKFFITMMHKQGL